MEMRKDPLVNDHYYHIVSRSIGKFKIFKEVRDFLRIVNVLKLYQFTDFNYSHSKFIELKSSYQNKILVDLKKSDMFLVKPVAYCIMPTHIHLLLKQVADRGISKYMARILNGYARYFNIKYQRIGPLWQGRFKSVLVISDEQLLHLTRYIHLNPTSAGLVKNPEDWPYSSYSQYIDSQDGDEGLCDYRNLFDLSPNEYRNFVNDRKSYQTDLAIIKNSLIDNYPG